VTHLVVKLSARGDSTHMVPIEFVAKSSARGIELSCDFATLQAMPHFTRTTHNDEVVPLYISNGVYENAPVFAVGLKESRATQVEQVPEGEVVIGDHAKGNAADGHIGRVAALEIDPATHRISSLVLREGSLWGRKRVTIPVIAVDFFDEEAVYLNWDKDRLAALPARTPEPV
jgi:hypothetical protein